VATFLYQYVFSKFVLVDRLQSDNGSHFTAELMRELLRHWNIKQQWATTWHPSSHGIIERLNCTIHNILAKFTGNLKENWPTFLPSAEFAMNTTIQPSLGYSPFYLIFGRQPQLPINDLLPAHDPQDTESDYASQVLAHLDELD